MRLPLMDNKIYILSNMKVHIINIITLIAYMHNKQLMVINYDLSLHSGISRYKRYISEHIISCCILDNEKLYG